MEANDNDFKNPDEFVEYLAERNPNMPLYLQTVSEFLESVWDYCQENPKYMEMNLLSRLFEPERVLIFRVPWVDDNGNVRVNRGYRVQFNSALGPYKGGLRFHPTVKADTLYFLGFEQTFKNSLTGLPLGSGKGGSDFNPRGKSEMEIMRFCQSFMTELMRIIGPSTDVPAGDIGVGGREIGYMFGQYKRIKHEFVGTLTGKGLQFGGSKGRVEATGYGAVYFAREMLRVVHKSKRKSTEKSVFKGKVCTVSGSGNVAQGIVEKLIELGAKVVSVSDSGGTIHDPNGITAEKLDYIKDLKNVQRGRIVEYSKKYKCTFLEKQRPWGIKCDVAFPAATQNELEIHDAKALVSNGVILICEAANMPCTNEAVQYILDNKILFGPAKAANAGGVATSGFEMSQNSMRLSWTKQEVEEKLLKTMQNIHEGCVKHGQDSSGFINYVKGANLAGFIKVAEAMMAQGVV